MDMLERSLVALVCVALAALAGQAWLLLRQVGQAGQILMRIEAIEARGSGTSAAPQAPKPTGLPAGAFAPTFALPDLNGSPFTLDTLRAAGKHTVLIFSDPGCRVCTALLPKVAAWQHDYADRMTIAVISRGSAEVNRAKLGDHAIAPVLLQQDREVAQAYRCTATPSAVVVLADGRIGSPLVAGIEKVVDLVKSVAGEPAAAPEHTPTLTIGDPAPAFALPALTGETVSIAELRGVSTLVVFWSPACGYCQHILSDLKALEAARSGEEPRLLIVSSKSVAENAALGFQSTVVLDEGFSVGNAFGARGTPAAVLIDANGILASEVVSGWAATLALANRLMGRESSRTERDSTARRTDRMEASWL